MKKQTDYQQLKAVLKDAAKFAKSYYKTDYPAQRMYLNDCLDSISKNYNLSEYQRNNLANYTCTLHPKN
jgi:Mg2+ and Co2+ transporter CorA